MANRLTRVVIFQSLKLHRAYARESRFQSGVKQSAFRQTSDFRSSATTVFRPSPARTLQVLQAASESIASNPHFYCRIGCRSSGDGMRSVFPVPRITISASNSANRWKSLIFKSSKYCGDQSSMILSADTTMLLL